MFTFEGNGIVLNLNNEAKDKQKYPRLLVMAIVTIISWYMLLALVCYFNYRGTASDYITANLGINGFTIFLYILFSINTIASYPIQILCAFEIIEDLKFFRKEYDSNLIKNIKIYSERVLVIVFITIIAIIVPRFVDFLNISGSLGASALGFILPPIYYLQTYGWRNVSKPLLVFNVFLVLFGVIGAIYSIYNSINNLVNGTA